jgi:hypothetical protein
MVDEVAGENLHVGEEMSYHLLEHATPLARKAHRCTWCGEEIPAGEKYIRIRCIYDGEPQVNKFHAECEKACSEEAAEYGPDFEFSPGENERPGSVL